MRFSIKKYLMLVTTCYASLQGINPQEVAQNINQFLDIAQSIIASKKNLDVLKLELEKIPLFIKGCGKLRTTDQRYPNIRVGNSLITLKDQNGDLVPKLDAEGKPILDETGKPVYQKLSVACNTVKDALSGVSKTLDYVKNTLLGSSSHPNALFIKLLTVLGMQSKIPQILDLSSTIDALQFFIDRVDTVMKINKAKAETESGATQATIANSDTGTSSDISSGNTGDSQTTSATATPDAETQTAPVASADSSSEQNSQISTDLSPTAPKG
jgi:hypothetical protein